MAQSFATEMARERFYEQMERYRNLNDGLDLPAAVIPLYFAAMLFFVDRLIEFWPTDLSWNRTIILYIVFLILVIFLATFQQNEARSRRMFYCRRRLVICLVLTTLATVCYYFENRLVDLELKSNGHQLAAKQS
jgi:hypothetical protein